MKKLKVMGMICAAIMATTMVANVSASAVETQETTTTEASTTVIETTTTETTTTITEATNEKSKNEVIRDYIDDKSRDIVKTLGKKAIEKGIDLLLANVPFGSTISATVKAQVLDLVGLGEEKQISTNELAEKLDALEDTLTNAIDEQTSLLIDKMHDTFADGTFRKDMDNLQSSVNIGNVIGNCANSKFSEEEKLIKLAMITGNNTQWQNSGMLIRELTNVANDLSGKSYMNQKNLFQLMYSNNTQHYKLSGEVMDAVNPYAVKVVIDYIKYAALTLSSLEAQQQLLSDDFDVSKITDKSLRKQYEAFNSDETSIENMKVRIMSTLFGADAFTENGIRVDGYNAKKNYGSVIESYKEFAKTYRLTYLPSNKNLSPNLIRTAYNKLIDNNEDKTETYGRYQRESTSKIEFENRLQKGGNGGNTNCLTINEMEDLFNYMNKARGNDTVKEFLTKMGFNTDSIIACNDFVVTGGGYYEKLTDISMWDTYIDLAALDSGIIKSTKWKNTTNNLFCADADYYDPHTGKKSKNNCAETALYMINGASDKDIQEYQDLVEKLVCKDMDNEMNANI